MKMDDEFLTYSALDSACMMEIHNKFWEELENGYMPAYRMTVDLMPVLSFMQTKGMRVNSEMLAETKIEVQQKIHEKQAELDELVGHPLNVNSPKACANYFYIELGLPPITKSKTKKITTDDMAMQRLARGTAKNPGLRQAKLVQEIRALMKLHNTYLDMTFDEDGRMRGTYNPRGTKFGRLSSGQTIFGTGMNFQNLPDEFKKFLVADPGYMLLEVDKRQAEWVVVAYFSNDANMIKAIKSGVDVHSYTASLMFDVPIDLVKYENKLIGHSTNAENIHDIRMADELIQKYYTPKWPRTMSLRQCGKKSNHGLNYDEGYRNFALLNEMLESESKKVIEMYHDIYPGIRISYDFIKRQLQKDRTLTNCFGRRVRFMGEWNQDLWKSAYSMIPQSTVVDSLNMGMVKIYNDPWITQFCNVDILAQVHDSILMQVPIPVVQNKEQFEELIRKIYTYTTPTLSYNANEFTIATDAKIGLNWGGHNNETNPEGMRDYESWEDCINLLSAKDNNGSGTG